MSRSRRRPALGSLMLFGVFVALGVYFTYAAVQGDHGVLRQTEVEAEIAELRAERDALATRLATLENRTRRLSDAYLDLDLLDERVRDVLGYARADEVILP